MLHEDMRTEDLVTAVMARPVRPTWTAHHVQDVELAIGYVEAGFAKPTDRRGEFHAMAPQGYIEAHGLDL